MLERRRQIGSKSHHPRITNVVDRQREALQLIALAEVFCKAGALYIKALLEGLDEFPETDEALRDSIEVKFKEIGLWGLKEQLLAIDPNAADFVKLDNPSRVKRALELVLLCGKPLSEIYKKNSISFSCFFYGQYFGRSHILHVNNNRYDEHAHILLPHCQLCKKN